MPRRRILAATSLLTVSLSAAFVSSAVAGERSFPELEVPFACGYKVTVSQSHGTFSHVGTDRWAWDFRVPEGTPVLAAAPGIVRLARSDSVRGGCDRSFGPDSNYVVVSHEGGVETQYLHFSKVFVRVGQRVDAGTPLGEVGRTGFSCGSHLHFQLQRPRGEGWAQQSVPAVFREIGDPEAHQEIVSKNCGRPQVEQPLQVEAATAVERAGAADQAVAPELPARAEPAAPSSPAQPAVPGADRPAEGGAGVSRAIRN